MFFGGESAELNGIFQYFLKLKTRELCTIVSWRRFAGIAPSPLMAIFSFNGLLSVRYRKACVLTPRWRWAEREREMHVLMYHNWTWFSEGIPVIFAIVQIQGSYFFLRLQPGRPRQVSWEPGSCPLFVQPAVMTCRHAPPFAGDDDQAGHGADDLESNLDDALHRQKLKWTYVDVLPSCQGHERKKGIAFEIHVARCCKEMWLNSCQTDIQKQPKWIQRSVSNPESYPRIG